MKLGNVNLYTGCTVKVIDEHHPMEGWIGVVTSQKMWSKPIYKPIPQGFFRIEMQSEDGRFHGDYHESQLEKIRCPGDKK